MKRIRNHFCLAMMALLLASPAAAIFVERFEPVWEEPGSSSDSAGKENEGASFTDPTTGMEFVLVKGGCYQMGSSDGDADEKPVHEVCVDDFYLGKHEVTQGQWQKVTGSNPANFKEGDNYPVEQVSWDDTQEFLRKLNQKNGKSLRLPTEAEWEYAARSGGKQEKYAGGDNVDVVAWYDKNSGASSHPVGQKQANGLGLYDMSGNVWEWTGDWYSDSYYWKSPKSNPLGPSGGSTRVYRGGGWSVRPESVRSAFRFSFTPDSRNMLLGFRLAFPAKSGSGITEVNAVTENFSQVITLKAKNGNVSFKHKQHSERMNCQVCHGIGSPGPFGIYKDKAHALCKDCHSREGQGPTKCGECHMKSNAPQLFRSEVTKTSTSEKMTQKITLKAKNGNISFDHSLHGNKLNCQVCHGLGTPAKIGLDKDEAHALCKNCHVKEGQGPTKCGECHKKI